MEPGFTRAPKTLIGRDSLRLTAPATVGFGAAFLGSLLLACSFAFADDGPEQPEDRKLAEANNWIYNDLPKGFAAAKRTGKPLFVVIRCPP